MSEINWSGYFGQRSTTRQAGDPKPGRFRLPSGLLSWESLITLGIVLIVFLSVVQSIEGAKWVTQMPSLYVTATTALLVAFFLARVNVFEGFLHLCALAIGIAVVFWQVLTTIPEVGPVEGAQQIELRMTAWVQALMGGGINTDTLPFVVLVVGLTFFAAYISCWAVFRWRNIWVALVPGGLALLTNISYLPGQFSFAFVTFLFGAILLMMRLHLVRKIEEWRRDGVAYPDFISLTSLNWTVLVALLLLVAAWRSPLANQSGLFVAVWDIVTSPVQGAIRDSNRLFSAIDAKKGVGVHKFTSTLPFQGNVKLSDTVVLQVQTSDPGLFLRGVAYDVYTAAGWKESDRKADSLENVGLDKALAGVEDAKKQSRKPVTADIWVEVTNGVLFSVGEPITSSVAARAETGGDLVDITSIRPAGKIKKGDKYTVVGAVSTASIERLRSAGDNYPAWVRDRYLQLPQTIPPRIKGLADEWSRGQTNSFDRAQAIENNLRTFATDYSIPVTPVGRDTVDYFLFDLRRGYFDYHASAMAVLLRSLGIPARVQVGYALDSGEFDPNAQVYLVSERSSYTWVEAYFPSYGWIEFNPTPDRASFSRPADDLTPTIVDDSSLPSDVPLDELPIDDLPALDGFVLPEESQGLPRAVVVLLWLLVAIASVAGIAALSFRLAWQRAVSGLGEPAQFWEKTVRLSSWASVGPRPQQTPREFARSLSEQLPEVSGLDFLAETYGRTQFGGKSPTAEESNRIRQIWSEIRSKLLAKILHWK